MIQSINIHVRTNYRANSIAGTLESFSRDQSILRDVPEESGYLGTLGTPIGRHLKHTPYPPMRSGSSIHDLPIKFKAQGRGCVRNMGIDLTCTTPRHSDNVAWLL